MVTKWIRAGLPSLMTLCLVPMAAAWGQEESQSSDEFLELIAGPQTDDATSGEDDAEDASVPADAPVYADTVSVEPLRDSATPTPSPRPAGNRLIEEITVTAQKREENLQDVPISVQAFSSERLDALGVTNQAGLAQITPSLVIGTQVGYTTIFLRGVGSDAYLTADPSVASYIDGIYFPFAQGLVQDFGAVERIEVLKGPQGTLFGRNTTGGAINVITRSPDLQDVQMSIQTEYAKFDDLHTRAYVNVPLTDTFAMSVSGIYNQADSYYSGTRAGEPLPKETSRGVRVKLRWMPTDELDFNLAGLRLKADGTNSFFAPNQRPTPLGQLLFIDAQPGYHGEVDAPVFYAIDNRVVYGQAAYSGSSIDLKLLGSYQDIQSAGLYDFDQSERPYVVFESASQYSKPKSVELQILSNDGTWGSDWLQFTGGVYYFKSRQGFADVRLQAGDIDLLQGTLLGLDLPPSVVDALQAFAPFLATGQIFLSGLVDTESVAEYLQTTFTFNDYVALTLGARYQSEKRSIAKSTVGLTQDSVLIDNSDRAVDGDGNPVSPSNTTKAFRPKVSIDVHPFGDDTLVYASWQKAIKAATYNVVAIYTQPAFVEPEKTTAYEVGVKTRLFDGLMTLNTAGFWYDITDLQQQYVSLLNGGAVSFENAGEARIRGVDFDSTTVLLPNVFDDLVLVLGGAYVDAKYKEYIGGGFNEQGIFTQNNDYTGNRLVRAPKFSASATLSKTWSVPGGQFEMAVDGYYNHGFYYAPSNFESTKQKAYTVAGARISYLYEPWSLRITAFGRNLTDEKYSNGALFTDFGQSFTLAAPENYGVRINWDY